MGHHYESLEKQMLDQKKNFERVILEKSIIEANMEKEIRVLEKAIIDNSNSNTAGLAQQIMTLRAQLQEMRHEMEKKNVLGQARMGVTEKSISYSHHSISEKSKKSDMENELEEQL